MRIEEFEELKAFAEQQQQRLRNRPVKPEPTRCCRMEQLLHYPPIPDAQGMVATTNGLRRFTLPENDNQSDTRSSTPETLVAAGDSPSSEQAAMRDDTPASYHGDLGDQDESQFDNDQEDEELPQIQFPQYMMYPSEYTEDIYQYFPGGFHPVHLGDILDDRFEVVHKLGYGGFATVWLCLETRTHEWRAVKIIRADTSSEDMSELDIVKDAKERGEFDPGMWEANHISLPLEHFWIEGPNGSHLCEVHPVHGPSIEDKWKTRAQDDGLAKLNDMVFQVASGVKFLHDRGICHGDLTPRNILVRLRDISHIGKQEMLDLLGTPELEEVYAGDVDPTPMAPRYKVVPIDSKQLGNLGMIDEVVIADFGESFRPSEEDVQWSGIPLQYAAPEAAFRCKPQLPSDIWSLACGILTSIANMSLVDSVYNVCTYVTFLEAALGALPEPYRTAHVEQLKETLEASGKDWRDYVGSGSHMIYIPEDQPDEDDGGSLPIVSEPNFYRGLKSNYDACAVKYGYDNAIHIILAQEQSDERITTASSPSYRFGGITLKPIPDEEVRLLGDLLSKMIKYDPEERLDIDGVLKHEWFTRNRASTDGKIATSYGNAAALNADAGHEESKTSLAGPEEMSDDGISPAETSSPKAVKPESNMHTTQLSPGAQSESSTRPWWDSVHATESTVQSTPNESSPCTGLSRGLGLPIIQSTDPEIMGSLLGHDSDAKVPTGLAQTVIQFFCIGFLLVALIPALYVYIMLLLVIPLFLRIGRRAWYS